MEVITISDSIKALSRESKSFAVTPNFADNSSALLLVRFIIEIYLLPRDLRLCKTSSPVSPAPINRTGLFSSSPKILCASSTPAKPTEDAPSLISVSVRTFFPASKAL